MSKETFMSLCDELGPFLQKQSTAMRDALSVETQVAATLYYLADEGRFRRVANAFGIGKSSVSTKMREACMVITKYLGPKYIKLLSTIEEVEMLTAGFLQGTQFRERNRSGPSCEQTPKLARNWSDPVWTEIHKPERNGTATGSEQFRSRVNMA